MSNNEKERIATHNRGYHLLRRVGVGISSVFHNPLKAAIAILYVLSLVLIWRNKERFLDFSELGAFAPMMHDLNQFALVLGMAIATVLFFLALGTPAGTRRTRNALLCIGLCNKAGEVPELLLRKRDKKCSKVSIWVFDSCGIPLHTWEAMREEIQTALNISVIRITWGKSRRRIIVYAVPSQGDIPEFICWDDRYFSSENFELAVGETYAGPLSINLAVIPHVLLGGSTGSGKTGLLKLLIMQALQKGATVFFVDFKHGVDYPRDWHRRCNMCFDEDGTLQMLTKLVNELEIRKACLLVSECSNIDEYNKEESNSMCRIIFACDEVAELLDKTGRSKAQKEIIDEITSKLATIARQGRACGIHLILATQRPDANVLPGQIKSNIDCRICGRADNILSQIILDSTDAATVIPKKSKGRFLMHDGTVFQAYLVDKSQL